MDQKETVFLSIREAIAALQSDFWQYAPQTPLFMDLCPLVLGPDIRIINDSRANVLWIAMPGRRHVNRLRRISPRDLGRLLIDTLKKSPPAAGVIADICRRTFSVLTVPSGNENGEKTGVWVYMDMEGFQCSQCGQCCRTLDYRNEILPGDFSHWKALGREDILARMADITRSGRSASEICPWLAPSDPKNKAGSWLCRIHDCKPDICKQYPGTRKHARMTGCIGFESR